MILLVEHNNLDCLLSVNPLQIQEKERLSKKILKDIARDFIASMLPLGELVKKADESYNGVDCYSSGHPKHEYTSGYAIEEVFKFFAQ